MGRMNNSKVTLGDMLWVFYIILLSTLTIIPAFKYSINYELSISICFVAIVFIFSYQPQYRKTILLIFVFGSVSGLFSWFNGNYGANNIINTPINYLRIALFSMLFVQLSTRSKKTRTLVWGVLTVELVYIAVTTMIAIKINPMIARELASGINTGDYYAYRMQNIGGFEVSYAIGLTFIVWISLAFYTKSVLKRVAFLSFAVLSFWFVLQVQYTTLMLLCIMTVILIILFKPGNVLTKIISIVAIIVIFFSIPILFRWMASLDVGDQMYRRLINLAAVFDGSSTMSQTTSRTSLYGDAFFEFLQSPIWGKSNSASLGESHSTILGLACAAGIIGVYAFGYTIKESYLILKDTCMTRIQVIMVAISVLVYVMLSFFNPINYAYEIALVVFLYIPLTIQLFESDNQEEIYETMEE